MHSIVLLKNLLLSTSTFNQLKYEKDKKRHGKIVAGLVGKIVLYAMGLFFCVMLSIGFGAWGFASSIPSACAIIITFMEFFFCLLKTNGYLFARSGYDMIMSLPFSVKTVVSSRFLYMYIKNLPWVLLISCSMMIGYGIFAKPLFIVYIIWILFTLLLPMIPMVLAAFIGAGIAAVSSGFRHKNIVQTILTFALVLLAFSSRFIIDKIFSDDKVLETIQKLSSATDNIKNVYLPVTWFEKSITELNVLSMLLFVVSALIVFEAAFLIVSRFYRQINTRLLAGASRKKYSLKGLSVRSQVASITFKEFRHFVSSTNYIVNFGIGIILCMILIILSLVIGLDKIIMFIAKGHYVDPRIILPAVPMIVFFLTGMASSTSVSYSLEGNNLWIYKSLPVSFRTLLNGKMLFNLCLVLPITLIGDVVLGIRSAGTPLEIGLCVLCGIFQSLYCTSWGMLLGILLPKFNWKVDIEVIKSSASVSLYMLPNMLITLALGVVSVIFGQMIGVVPMLACISGIYFVLALVPYIILLVKTSAKKSA